MSAASRRGAVGCNKQIMSTALPSFFSCHSRACVTTLTMDDSSVAKCDGRKNGTLAPASNAAERIVSESVETNTSSRWPALFAASIVC